MMTSGFTNPPSPRDKGPADAKGCSVELLFRAPCSEDDSVHTVKKSLAFEALSLMGEAFYWRYVEPENVPPMDLTNPVHINTLAKHTGKAQALAPDTPFFISAAVDEPVDLGEGQHFTPAFVTIEKPVTRILPTSVSAKLHGWTGALGKAQKTFEAPSDLDLLSLFRIELEKHGDITSDPLIKKIELYAGLEFYHGAISTARHRAVLAQTLPGKLRPIELRLA